MENIRIGLDVVVIVLFLFYAIVQFVGKNKVKQSQSDMEDLLKEGLYQLERNQNIVASNIESKMYQSMTEASQLQQNYLSQISHSNQETVYQMMDRVDTKLELVRTTLDQKLHDVEVKNEANLEKIRMTVDEKLNETLEQRLGKSFQLVSERLEQVHRGLGEVNLLAEGVGDLKKVLTNVKLRGVMGEMQLEQILEQILSPTQYRKNIKLNPNTQDIVEFAICMPGKTASEEIYLPIDAKFPVETYFRLLDAYENSQKELIEKQGKELERVFRKNAKDICTKYIYPPVTTDFALMFVPFEGLYAELTKRPHLLEDLQKEYKVVVAGPSNTAALLNTLQMGFRTLAIERRSSEIWELLSVIKTEFYKFGAVLEKAQHKLNDAGSELDQLVGVRSRKLLRELDKITELQIQKGDEDEK